MNNSYTELSFTDEKLSTHNFLILINKIDKNRFNFKNSIKTDEDRDPKHIKHNIQNIMPQRIYELYLYYNLIAFSMTWSRKNK